MDSIDKKLIELLSNNARVPLKQLAEQVYLSSPAVYSRLERMEQMGIVEGYQARLNLQKLGFQIKAFINVTLRPQDQQEFASFVRQAPNVVECHHVTGEYSMILKVYFQTTRELDNFVLGLQRFGKTQTQVVFSTVTEDSRALLSLSGEDGQPSKKPKPPK